MCYINLHFTLCMLLYRSRSVWTTCPKLSHASKTDARLKCCIMQIGLSSSSLCTAHILHCNGHFQGKPLLAVAHWFLFSICPILSILFWQAKTAICHHHKTCFVHMVNTVNQLFSLHFNFVIFGKYKFRCISVLHFPIVLLVFTRQT